MRFEPANSKYFAQEICSPSFTDSLRLLGCFEESLFSWRNSSKKDDKSEGQNQLHFDQLFLFPINDLPPKGAGLSKAESAAILLRFLYEMAIDVLDRSGRFHAEDPSGDSALVSTNMATSGIQAGPPLIIVYPCIVISMIHLIQFLPTGQLCSYILEKILNLLALERNLQVMCDLGVIGELLSGAFAAIFTDEAHPLHGQVQAIFERLASQHIQTKDLR